MSYPIPHFNDSKVCDFRLFNFPECPFHEAMVKAQIVSLGLLVVAAAFVSSVLFLRWFILRKRFIQRLPDGSRIVSPWELLFLGVAFYSFGLERLLFTPPNHV